MEATGFDELRKSNSLKINDVVVSCYPKAWVTSGGSVENNRNDCDVLGLKCIQYY